MRPLRLELAASRRWPLVAWIALAAALFVAADSAWQAVALRDELARAEQSARPGGRRDAPAPAVKLDPALQRDVRFAEQVVQRLSLPWDELFAAIESASGDRIALLGVEPDSQRGEVRLTGEAADYKALLAYLGRLSQPGRLSGVHLVRHEIKADDPQRPLTFIVAAGWRTTR